MASLLVLSSSSASRNGQTYRLTQQISEEEGDDEKDEKIARSRVFAHTTELAFAPAPVDTTMPAIITAMCTEAPVYTSQCLRAPHHLRAPQCLRKRPAIITAMCTEAPVYTSQCLRAPHHLRAPQCLRKRRRHRPHRHHQHHLSPVSPEACHLLALRRATS